MEERSKHGQTNNKVKQHSTPKAVTFPKKNELPRVGFKPTILMEKLSLLYCDLYTMGKYWLKLRKNIHVQSCNVIPG